MDTSNLGDYVNLVIDATVGTGIVRQMEAFKCGFDQVCCPVLSTISFVVLHVTHKFSNI